MTFLFTLADHKLFGFIRRFALSLAAVLAFFHMAGAQAAEPIRIGVLVPLSGGGGAYGAGMAAAAAQAAEFINQDAGGVLNGRKIEIIVADDESNPTAGVAAARKLIDVSRVSAIVGLWSSAVAMAVKPLTIEKGIPLLVTGSGDEITQGDNQGLVWRFQATGRDWGKAFARAAVKDGAHTASLLVLHTPFTLSMVDPFIQEFTAAGGRVLDTVYYNPGQPSYRAEVEKAFAQKPDAVFVPSYLPDLSAIAREIYRSGFNSTLYANSSAADAEGAFVKNVGKAVAEGIHHIQSIPPQDSAAYHIFAEKAGISPNTLAIFPSNVWDEISVLALAIEKSGSAEPRVFARSIPDVVNGPGVKVESPVAGLNALRAGKNIAYSGAGSQFTFTPSGDQLNRLYGHFIIRDGVNQQVDFLK
ncbi:ABC transporter substrate-binding protein [Brenneria tiliae]|uniref:ABC transporter substrate-binding protein n=1 Tax=Brenneria tiliae TaxID=2914984 RepID=UPI002014F665|nr:ABC transporter substrate-binding protein [Brenneria tiliae]MCL2896065.1 ABC transporter substrate-binding protein [Brenneria tiliae]MCL2900536.1 ABC transporter substrate-binding protein [Brenneria tiliae]